MGLAWVPCWSSRAVGWSWEVGLAHAHADSTAFGPPKELVLFEVSSPTPSYWKEDLACCDL